MSSQEFLALIFCTFLASIFFLLKKWEKKNNSGRSKTKRPLPPGPPKLPIIGNLHQLKHPLHRTLHDLSRKYGDLMLLQLGTVPTLIISSADATREVITNHDTTFGGRASRYATDVVTYGSNDIVFSNYGEYWRQVRKVAVLELLSPKRVQTFAVIRDEEVAFLLDSIASSAADDHPLDMSKLLHEFSNNILCRAAFGRKFHGGSSHGRIKSPQELLEETQFLVGSISLPDFFPWMAWLNKINGFEARVRKNFKELDELYDIVIQEHLDPDRPKSDHEDLVDVLLRLQKDPTHPVSRSKNFVKALIADMFIAGTDAIAATLVWTMTEIIRNPSALKRAQKEVRSKVNGKDKVEESDLQELLFLRAVVKETLRLHAPTPLMIPRKTLADCEIKGYRIPANTMVFINALSMAMDPKSWDNPTQFRPERFLDSPVDFRGQHYELVPFGVGRRACPGLNFACVAIELVIANLMHRFDWGLPQGMCIEDVDMQEAIGIGVNKKNPLYLMAIMVAKCP